MCIVYVFLDVRWCLSGQLLVDCQGAHDVPGDRWLAAVHCCRTALSSSLGLSRHADEMLCSENTGYAEGKMVVEYLMQYSRYDTAWLLCAQECWGAPRAQTG